MFTAAPLVRAPDWKPSPPSGERLPLRCRTQRARATSGWGTRVGLKGVTQSEKANLRRLPRAVSTSVRTLTQQMGARPRVSPTGSRVRIWLRVGTTVGGPGSATGAPTAQNRTRARAHTLSQSESAPRLLGSQLPGGDAYLCISRRRPHWAAGQGRPSRTLLYNCPWTHNY